MIRNHQNTENNYAEVELESAEELVFEIADMDVSTKEKKSLPQN